MGKNTGYRFLKFWFPVILYSAIIFSMSAVPRLALPGGGFTDKLAHILEYLFFGFLLTRALKSTSHQWTQKKTIGIVFLLSFLYGFSDEIHQAFVPGRIASFADVLADGIGGFLGGHLFYIRNRKTNIDTLKENKEY